MKKNLLVKIMRGVALITGFICFAVLSVTAYTVKGQSPLKQKVSVHLNQASLKEALDNIAEAAGVAFMYSGQVAGSPVRITLEAVRKPLKQVLDEMLAEHLYSYSLEDEEIIVRYDPEKLKKNPSRSEAENQQHLVSGRVSGETGVALPGVNIMEKGTANSTVTDTAGNYRITVSDSSAILIFSSIGFISQETAVNGKSEMNVTLETDIERLEEIVVVGYTTQQKKDVTSSVASVDVENLQKRAVSDVTQALQGTVTGVNITATDGNPGSAMNFNIRGVSTLGAGENTPLVIVDGVQITGLQIIDFENTLGDLSGTVSSTGLENINPNDIESIEILKDASAAAIYGSRAANGVVLVTTKRGKRGKPIVRYNNYLGLQTAYENTEVTNAAQYVGILQKMYGNDLADPDVSQAARDYLANPDAFQDYNWQDLIYDEAFMQSHGLAVSSGGDFGNYRISAGYLNQDGITLNTGYERFNLRANSDFRVSDKITVGQGLSLANSTTTPEPFSFSRSVYYQSLKMYPYFPPTTDGDEWNTTSFYWGGGTNPENHIRNPFHYNSLWDRDIVGNNVAANLYGEIEIIDGLRYKISGSYALAQLRTHTKFGDKGDKPGEYFNSNKSIEELRVDNANWNVDNLLTYNKTFGKHTFDLMAGFVVQKFTERTQTGYKDDFLSDITSTLDGLGGKNATVSGNLSESALLSLLGKVFYAYDDKYLLTVNFRRDGSSRFAKDYRWGNFPGVSLGWRVSNELFWQNAGLIDVITDFKLRAGYGELGRQNVGNYDYKSVLEFEPVVFGDVISNGLITGTAINEAVTWELLVSRNIGVDFELWNGQIHGAFEYYNQRTEDMIIGVPTEPSAGGGELQSNVGEILNKGLEMTLGYSKMHGDLTYDIGFNLSTTNTTLEEIGSDLIFRDYLAPEWDVPPAIIIYEGRGPAQFWLIETDGIFKSQEEINAHISSDGTVIQPDAQPGDIRFVDFNDDGEISEEGDRQFMGLGVPDLNLGFNFSASYKNFDMNLGLYGAFGHKILNGPLYLLEQNYGFGNYGANLLDAFDPVTNPDSDFPRLNPVDSEENWNSRPTSDRYLEKGDFVKIRNLEFGYKLPGNILEKVHMRSVRIFVRGQNLFAITSYKGNDPEIGRDGFFNAGIDRGSAPQARSFQMGVNIEF